MRLFVTGGAGFIGSNFIRYIQQELCQVGKQEGNLKPKKLFVGDGLSYRVKVN